VVSATISAQVGNVGDVYGYELEGAGPYRLIAGRVASVYMTIDL